jgi:hypothetical protein
VGRVEVAVGDMAGSSTDCVREAAVVPASAWV